MLELYIKEKELYDELNEEFILIPNKRIKLEHSLVSISKWEFKWKKPFLKPNYTFSKEEFLDYVKCMTITQNVPDYIYSGLDNQEILTIKNYINDNHTATTFADTSKINKKARDTITSEMIYYWMTAYNIPIECQCWNLSRLLTLIRICSIKNSNNRKMTKRDILNQNKQLNEQRRKQLGSKG